MKALALLIVAALLCQFVSCGTPSCAAYCTLITQVCNGTNAQYTDEAQCLNLCPHFTLGTDDTAAAGALATIGCRTYHASAANSTGQYSVHCPHAGPSGGNNCGTYCDALCQLTTSVAGSVSCNGTNKQYNDFNDCNNTCVAAFNHSGVYQSSTVHDTDVPTTQCRIYHATVALGSQALADQHCAHTSTTSGACGTKLVNYCNIYSKFCAPLTSLLIQKNNGADCTTFGASLNQTAGSQQTSTRGDTLDCRDYHAIVGGSSAANNFHCYHATISGNNTCGNWCDVFCDMTARVCTGANQQFTDRTQCMTNCSLVPLNGNPGDQTGNTLQCRIYHVGVANQSPALATQHCPHANTVNSAGCTGTATTTTTTGTATTTTTTAASTTTTATTASTGNAYTVVISSFLILGMLFV
jgi:hypothetical protein